MRGKKEMLDELVRRRETIRAEIANLKGQEQLLDDLIRQANGEAPKRAAPRTGVKQTVLDLLDRVGSNGLNAAIAVDLAREDGIALDRGTVSSLLSRFKSQGVVIYDGSLYRLKGKEATIHPIRTSGTLQ